MGREASTLIDNQIAALQQQAAIIDSSEAGDVTWRLRFRLPQLPQYVFEQHYFINEQKVCIATLRQAAYGDNSWLAAWLQTQP